MGVTFDSEKQQFVFDFEHENFVRKKAQKYIKVAGKTTSTIAKFVRKTYLCTQKSMYHA